MIYTVTLNPSVDIFVQLDRLTPQKLHRIDREIKLPGGKGINVSRALRRLGIPSIATGFIGGFTGSFIVDWLTHEDIRVEFTEIMDDTRINIKLMERDGALTPIHVQGANISLVEVEEFIYYMSRVKEGDVVIISGSIPPSVERDIYRRIVSICRANKANFVMDTDLELVYENLEHRPLLVKPNLNDIEQMFHITVTSYDELIPYGKKLLALGAQHAIISLGSDGAILFVGDKIYRSYGIEGKLVDSSGSRDAMIAGFIGTLFRTSNPLESFRVASAAASATAFTTGLASADQMRSYIEKVDILDMSLEKQE